MKLYTKILAAMILEPNEGRILIVKQGDSGWQLPHGFGKASLKPVETLTNILNDILGLELEMMSPIYEASFYNKIREEDFYMITSFAKVKGKIELPENMEYQWIDVSPDDLKETLWHDDNPNQSYYHGLFKTMQIYNDMYPYDIVLSDRIEGLEKKIIMADDSKELYIPNKNITKSDGQLLLGHNFKK